MTVADATSSVAGAGAPFYFSWSPGGGGVAVHVGGDQFSIVGTDGETTGLGSTSGSYLSPQWTSAGIFYLDADGLRLHDAVDSSQLVATVPGFVLFVANEQGTRMAIQSTSVVQPGATVALQQIPEILPNAVMVIDLATREVQRATTRESLGFFWGPNGERLLILEISPVRGYIDAFVWEDGETRFVSSFQPASTFVRNVLPFFSQYASVPSNLVARLLRLRRRRRFGGWDLGPVARRFGAEARLRRHLVRLVAQLEAGPTGADSAGRVRDPAAPR